MQTELSVSIFFLSLPLYTSAISLGEKAESSAFLLNVKKSVNLLFFYSLHFESIMKLSCEKLTDKNPRRNGHFAMCKVTDAVQNDFEKDLQNSELGLSN